MSYGAIVMVALPCTSLHHCTIFVTKPKASPACDASKREGARCCRRFTRSAELLQRVGSVLLPAGSARPLPGPPRWLVARDAFGCASEDAAQALYQPLSEKFPEVSELISLYARETTPEATRAHGVQRVTAGCCMPAAWCSGVAHQWPT